MKVIDNLLFDDNGTQVTYRKSPHHGGGIRQHKFLIIHYTAASTAESAISWMLSPQSKVSAHLHEDREGKFVQLVSFDIIAWHAGESKWGNTVGINSWSIGIELQNTGTQEYTKVQLDELAKAAKAIVQQYGIEEILGHSDIAPSRKTDPGKQFPMEWLRGQVYGTNTAPTEIGVYKTTSDLNLRKGAGTNFDVLETLKKGTDVRVIDVHGEWSHVYAVGDDNVGYVASKYLTKK